MFTSSQIFILAFNASHSIRLSSLSTFHYTSIHPRRIYIDERTREQSVDCDSAWWISSTNTIHAQCIRRNGWNKRILSTKAHTTRLRGQHSHRGAYGAECSRRKRGYVNCVGRYEREGGSATFSQTFYTSKFHSLLGPVASGWPL